VISLAFEPPVGDEAWDRWVAEGRAAASALLAAEDGERTINERLYKAQRERFLDVTNWKCAYCETRLGPGQGAGDVEHYRPKARARDGEGRVVHVQRDGVEIDHPGYFWLAYDWTNLLPSCLTCNRRATDLSSGEMLGKADWFPTLNSFWACRPEEVELEQPALLNPWVDDPAVHLTFDPETGIVGGSSERGRITIEVFGLNREQLLNDRRRAARDAARRHSDHLKYRVAATQELADGELAEINDGTAQYLAIARTAICQRWALLVPGGLAPPGLTDAA
jgi:hypothetical protein